MSYRDGGLALSKCIDVGSLIGVATDVRSQSHLQDQYIKSGRNSIACVSSDEHVVVLVFSGAGRESMVEHLYADGNQIEMRC